MKKQDILGLIVYVIILALAAVFGLVVIRQYSTSGRSGMDTGIFILFVAGAIVTGVIFNALMFEAAHVIGAKIGGYNITSFAVLGFTWSKVDGKFKFHFASFDGFTGETKIVPNKKKSKESNPTPYLIMGTIFYAIEVVISVFCFSLLSREDASSISCNIAYFIIIVMAVGGMILLYNIVPFQLDSMTDGYRLRLVSGKKNKEAFNKMLLGEIGEEQKNEQDNKEVPSNSFSGDLKLNEILVCLEKDNFVEAEKLVDDLINDINASTKKVSNKVSVEAHAQKIFLMFINREEQEAIKYVFDNIPLREKKQLSEENTLPTLRAYLLIAGLVDASRSECVRTLDKVFKAYKHTDEIRRKLESKLFNMAIDLVHSKHQDWNLIEYRINEEN